MNQELIRIIQDRLEKLPPTITSAISSVPWLEKIKNIAQTNNLDLERSESLAMETTLMVLGLQSPKKFPENLFTNVGLDEAEVIKISDEVDQLIIQPIQKAIGNTEQKINTNIPELSPDLLPEILPGQTAHNARPLTPERSDGGRVPHVESSERPTPSKPITRNANGRPNLEFPQSGYQKDKDPYREPLE